jgi:hypothetical protein
MQRLHLINEFMKRSLLLAASALVISIAAFAQKGNNQVGIGAELDVPLGSFGDAYKTGFGGTIKGLYGIGEAGQLTFTTGYSSFKGKSETAFGYSYEGQTFTMVPLLAGYRHHFNSFYLEGQLGATVNGTKANGTKVESMTKFAFAANLGYEIKGLDISVRYHTEGDVLSMFAARIGYNISFGNKAQK